MASNEIDLAPHTTADAPDTEPAPAPELTPADEPADAAPIDETAPADETAAADDTAPPSAQPQQPEAAEQDTPPAEPAAAPPATQPAEPSEPATARSVLEPATLPCSFIVGSSRTEWVIDMRYDDWERAFAQQLRAIADEFDPPPRPLVWPDGELVAADTVAALIDQNGTVIPTSSMASSSTNANTHGVSMG